jgi:biopolymer transport protein ExbB
MRTRVESDIRLRTAMRPAVLVLLLATLVTLWPGNAAAWWNDQWTLRKKITIDTGTSGAGISEPIGTIPVLVRLHLGNFRFDSAKEDGSDLRFVAGDDKTPLKFHIEKFDSLLAEALVWVSVPDLKPGTKTDLWLYYVNPKAPSAADAKGTYDSDTLLVYHFAERGAPPQDSSAWANSAQSVVPVDDAAIIGQGARFDGQTTLTLPASPSLGIPEGGPLTWSAWAKMTAPQPRAVLYARHDGANSLVIGLDNGVPFVEATTPDGVRRSGEAAPLAAGGWHHLAVTAGNGRIVLYADGNSIADFEAVLPAMSGTAFLGGDVAAAPSAPVAPPDAVPSAAPAETPAPGAPSETPAPGAPSQTPAGSAVAPASAGFIGEIDELHISKVARAAGFIKFEAVGEGPDEAKLISFSVDEQISSWFSGYFVIILQSVTIDGWVVIGLLAMMAIISWIVMLQKAAYLNRVAKGNVRFLSQFGEAGADLDSLLRLDGAQGDVPALAGRANAKDGKILRNSSLHHLFDRGAQEIHRRFALRDGRTRTLSEQSVQAIRAALDSTFVRETQRLNRLMVILTIAISGGPFLGLLGTVVGVMITFASIAATGDVNINAIAPGISAALVATVAGLGVAIPALFGYNYLISQIKDMTSEMQVFIDEFVTRIAESYHDLADGPRKIAAE